jgi:hypothetical protein
LAVLAVAALADLYGEPINDEGLGVVGEQAIDVAAGGGVVGDPDAQPRDQRRVGDVGGAHRHRVLPRKREHEFGPLCGVRPGRGVQPADEVGLVEELEGLI